jgi:hypothetical protein
MLRTQELWRKYLRHCLAKAWKQKALISMRLEFDDFVKGRVVKIKDDHIVVVGYWDRKMKGVGAERLEVYFSSIAQLNLPPKLV